MATRGFISTNTAAISPDYGSGWDTGHALRLVGSTTAQNTAQADAVVPCSDSGTQKLAFQVILAGLAAQTISGTFKAQFLCAESNTAANCFFATRIAKCASDGSSVTEIVATVFPNAGAHEFVLSTLTNRRADDSDEGGAIDIPSTDLNANDCLIMEFGVSESTTSARNFTMRYGDPSSASDLPEDLTTTDTALRPWWEFSANLSFAAGGRTTKNTRSHPLGIAAGVNFRVARGARLALPDKTLWLPNGRAA